MRRFSRFVFLAIVLAALGLVALGLVNERRGLPSGSLLALRELPRAVKHTLAQTLARIEEALPESEDEAPHSGTALQQLQTAIGCGAPSAQSPDPGSQSEAYSWLDDEGVRSFSDQPPTGAVQDASSTLTLSSGHREFFVSVRTENAVIPSRFEGQISAAAKRAYDQWRDWLGDEAMVRSHINVRFIGDEAQFREIYGKSKSDEWMPVGFYRIQSNEALILYTPSYQALALSTAFHEVSHLITAWHLGPTPPWLNEGLAEHFETMQVSQQSASFSDNAYHIDLLRSEGPVALSDIVQLSGKEWMASDTERRYASAWSVVAFMLDSPAGQRTLQSVIREAYAQRCTPGYELLKTLGSSYPGGITAFERDWRRWLDQRYSERPPSYTTRPSSSVRRTAVP